VKIPASYLEPTIVIRITKGNVSFDCTKLVIDGFALIELLDNAPEGFMNGYGSPIYELVLLDQLTYEPIELQTSGDPVTSLFFQVIAGTSSQNQYIINY
jgi:hypothetical protein